MVWVSQSSCPIHARAGLPPFGQTSSAIAGLQRHLVSQFRVALPRLSPSVDSEASQTIKSGRAVEAAAKCVPSRSVVPALGLCLLPPAGLRGPHLHGAQHPQEAGALGRDYRRWQRGVPADGGELRLRPHAGQRRSGRAGEMSIFLMKLSGLFF